MENEKSDKKRIFLFVLAVIGLVIFTGWLIWSNVQQTDDSETPAPAPAPIIPTDEETIPENPDDIGIDEEGDADFLTGDEAPGVMNDVDTNENLETQADIYEAAKAAEAGIWVYENYGTETDSDEREETLKSLFSEDTPMPLALPSKKERLEATTGLPMEFIVNIHATNGMGGTEDDYRVEVIGEKQTVIKPKDGTLLNEDSYNGMNRITTEDIRWVVSMKKIESERSDDGVWVVYNFNSNEVVS